MIALVALWETQELAIGTAMRMGPGYYPRLLAYLIGLIGVVLLVGSVTIEGGQLESWNLTNIALVLGAIVVFAFTIRSLGLVIAGALLMVVSACAAQDRRWREILLFVTAMLTFSVLLFPIALNLPLPIWPRL